jgi:hypothetical protein
LGSGKLQLTINYPATTASLDEWNLRRNSSMISRARVHARARKGASVRTPLYHVR